MCIAGALHTSSSKRDQGFHKDGHHIPVRDHRPRWIMGLYYPCKVKLDMGPTCIVPQSQYFEVDRLQWGTLATGSDPPTSANAPSYQQWVEAVKVSTIKMNGSDPAARDEVLQRTGEFFGSQQKKLTVPAGKRLLTTPTPCLYQAPSGDTRGTTDRLFIDSAVRTPPLLILLRCLWHAGSIVLIHFDILHRGSRQAFAACGEPTAPLPDELNEFDPTIDFRPMFKLQVCILDLDLVHSPSLGYAHPRSIY